MSNEIIKSNTTEVVPVSETFDFNIPEGYICTVDISTFEGAATVTNAINASTSLNDYKEDVFEIVDIITVPGVRSRTGEQCINTHLVLKDGTMLFSQSDGVARSAKFIVGFLGQYIHDGIKVRVKETALRNGNSLKTLELVAK